MRKPLLHAILILVAVSPQVHAQRRRRHSTPSSPQTGTASTPAQVIDSENAAAANGTNSAPTTAAPQVATALPATEPQPPVVSPQAPVVAAAAGPTAPVATVATAQVAAEPPAAEPVAPVTVPRRFAFEFGPVIGLHINLSPYGVGPNLGLEIGGRLAVGPGYFAFGLRGHYERYGASGSNTAPCNPAMGAPDDPCISPPPGTYQWNLTQQTVTIGLPLSFRFLSNKRVHPYVLAQPQVVLERVDATTFDLTNVETATRVGVFGAVGVQLDVGPGGVWLEAGFRWVQLPHRSTGRDAQLSLIGINVGYRFAL